MNQQLAKTIIRTIISACAFTYIGHLLSQEFINNEQTSTIAYVIISYIAISASYNAFGSFKEHLSNKPTPETTTQIIPLKIKSGHIIEFNLQQTVYIKTDEDQKPAIIYEIILQPFNSVAYNVMKGQEASTHYPFELSLSKDIVLSTSY